MEEEIITIEEEVEELMTTLEEDVLYCNDYELLENKPTINTVEVIGDKTGADYGLVDAETGKGLSANDFTNTLKNKLDGIAEGAEVNVNADWNSSSGDSQILNKPTIPAALSELSDDSTHRLVTDTEKTTWNGKQDAGYVPYTNTKTSLDATLIVSTMYEIGTLTGNVSMALPSGTTRKRICVKFNCTGTAYTFTLTGTNFTTFSLTPVANTCYDVEFEYNGVTSKWTGYVNSYLA